MTEGVRTRFSPSPTGMIHLGNARTALFCALFALKDDGVFIIRIEDTDVARSEDRYVEELLNDLTWLDARWQEGPQVGGDYAPYWQSKRQEIYDRYYRLLEKQGLIYPCFCSDQELMLARKMQLAKGNPPRYSGICKNLSAEAVNERIGSGKKYAWRFAVPADQTIEFTDVVKGVQHFNSNDIGDFIIRRADGTAPFLFCNAIDDAEMKVSHVLRGEDHLANTPRQLMLLAALDLHTPCYGHLSMIVGEDGAPLSKRHGSFSVHEMRARGYLPIAIINYLARLGHTCEAQELLSPVELAKHFQLEKLSKSPAKFDVNQLKHWQKLGVQALDNSAFWLWLGCDAYQNIPDALRDFFAETIKHNVESPQEVMMWERIFFHDPLTIEEAELTILHAVPGDFFVEAIKLVEACGATFEEKDFERVLNELKERTGKGGKQLFLPLRIALTGKTYGPELIAIAKLLGKERLIKRLSDAKERGERDVENL